MRKFLIAIVIVFTTFIMACTEQSKPKMGVLYPNDDSELTLLMREMFDYYENMKGQIEKGHDFDNSKAFTKIHTAGASQEGKTGTPFYEAMAHNYLSAAQRLKTDAPDPSSTFNEMVETCMQCHRQVCPGPMVKIKKLYLES